MKYPVLPNIMDFAQKVSPNPSIAIRVDKGESLEMFLKKHDKKCVWKICEIGFGGVEMCIFLRGETPFFTRIYAFNIF